MRTLEEAWSWYEAVYNGMKRLAHLAKFWGEFPWGQGDAWVDRVAKDNVLRDVEAIDLSRDAGTVTNEHDDLAILVLFSAFEAVVRDHLKAQLAPEISRLKHPSLQKACRDVEEAVEHGSFGRLLEAFKISNDHSHLIEQVNQIRRWRNWVAHGRRPEMRPADEVRPRDAYDRLSEFLDVLRALDADGQPAPPSASP
jgi:hypothetical protein